VHSGWQKSSRSVALKFIPYSEKKRVDFEIIQNAKAQDVGEGTVRRGSATCPVCGYTTPVASVRRQIKARRGGAADARLFCVVTTKTGKQGRSYRQLTERDLKAVRMAEEELERRKAAHTGPLSLVPDEAYPDETGAGALSSSVLYGLKTWGDIFTSRQALALTTLVKLTAEVRKKLDIETEREFGDAIQTCLALIIDKMADKASSICRWKPSAEYMAGNTFSRQALPMVWDFCEANIFGEVTGDIRSEINWVVEMISHGAASISTAGQTVRASSTSSFLPEDAAHAFITDPPYYDAIAYGDLSDFFYVWLRRTIGYIYPSLFSTNLVDKTDEIVQLSKRFKGPYSHKTREYFEAGMKDAMTEGRRVLAPNGLCVVVFAHKSTSGWEAMIQAMIHAGWIFTGSWPIDTEMGVRMNAMDTASLASSIHLVCRPREDPSGEVRTDDVGYWSDVLAELPKRIHAWLPGLAAQGVVGADAIFSCLGPALEIYSRYSRVEKASGEVVTLKEYLEEVWAAVSREALGMIFEGAGGSGLEEDARLTAMWLWTLSTGGNGGSFDDHEGDADEGDEGVSGKGGKMSGFVLE